MVKSIVEGVLVQQIKQEGHKDTESASDEAWHKFRLRFNSIVQNVVQFAKRIPRFLSLELDDQIHLIKGGCFEVACIVHASYIDGKTNCLYIESSTGQSSITRDEFKAAFALGDSFIDHLFNFSSRLNAFTLTGNETALFAALILLAPERQGLQSKEHISKLQESLIQALQTQISVDHPKDVGLFARLLMIISSLREVNSEHKNMLANVRSCPELAADSQSLIFGVIEWKKVEMWS